MCVEVTILRADPHALVAVRCVCNHDANALLVDAGIRERRRVPFPSGKRQIFLLRQRENGIILLRTGEMWRLPRSPVNLFKGDLHGSHEEVR